MRLTDLKVSFSHSNFKQHPGKMLGQPVRPGLCRAPKQTNTIVTWFAEPRTGYAPARLSSKENSNVRIVRVLKH